MSRAPALVILALAIAACEHKIEEPVPPMRPEDPTTVLSIAPPAPASAVAQAPTASAPAASASAGAGPLKGRCVRKTPDTPERPLKKGPDPRCPKDDEPNAPKLSLGHVFFRSAGGESKPDVDIKVEIAKNDHDRQRGLMFRKSMADDHGMIFVFPLKDNHTFWMHNTCIPLDMLYIDEDGLIVGIQENTPTISDDTFEVGCSSKYVLEMNAGWSRAHGVAAGQFVKLSL